MSSLVTKSGSSLDEDSPSVQGYSCSFEDARRDEYCNTLRHGSRSFQDLLQVGPLRITLTTYPCDDTRTSNDPITFSTYGWGMPIGLLAERVKVYLKNKLGRSTERAS